MLEQQEKRNQLYRRFAEMPRRNVWNTYDQASCKLIAEAIGVEATAVWKFKDDLEDKAWWYRAGIRRPLHTVPSKKLERLNRVIKYAALLLQSRAIASPDIKQISRNRIELLQALNIKSLEEARDGVGDNSVSFEIFEALASEEPCDEGIVANAVSAIGQSRDIHQIFDGAAEIKRRAIDASSSIRSLTAGHWRVPVGNQRDAALNEWIVYVIGLYVKITGNPPGTSVTKPGTDRESVPGGPLIRFLMAAGRQLHKQWPGTRPEYERFLAQDHRQVLESEHAMRARVRRLLEKLAGRSEPFAPR